MGSKKKIIIGVTGSIAAFKIINLCRELLEMNFSVELILTKSAENFISRLTLVGLGCVVHSENKLDDNYQSAMLHINVLRSADLVLIAPATANFIAKISHGLADDLLSEAILAHNNTAPVCIVPAMNSNMWQNQITEQNVARLKQAGYTFWGPDSGVQACGDVGYGRMIEVAEILSNIQLYFQKSSLYKENVVMVTLGATIENIDPVRYISNYSSGKMGLAIIKQLLDNGATVIAVCARVEVNLPIHPNLQIVKVSSALNMYEAVEANLSKYPVDYFIGVAAVADYRVMQVNSQKIKKSSDKISIELIKNPDIISSVKAKYPKLKCIAFAAETTDLLANARDKLVRKNLDAIIANDVSDNQVFQLDHSAAFFISLEQQIAYAQCNKQELAGLIIADIKRFV